MTHFQRDSKFRSLGYASLLVVAALAGVLPWQAVQGAGAADAPRQADAREQESVGRNLGFEQQGDNSRPQFWGGGGKGYTLTLDAEKKHSGELSGKIVSLGNGVFGSYTQCIAADSLRGKRVAYDGFLKTTIEDGHAGLWMRVDGEQQIVLNFDNMNDRRITGTTDWKEYQVVLDVPESATKICFGFLLTGKGVVWGDDFTIHAVGPAGEGPKTTGKPVPAVQMPTGIVNADFEKANENGDLPIGWGGGGKGYLLTRDTDVSHGGTASGRIEQQDETGTFGTFTQVFDANAYLGKRIKYTSFLKTKDAKAVGLWCRVDRPQKPLSFDNMMDRPVTGTTDWKSYSIILDVQDDATRIAYGFLIHGHGTVWGDDLKIEILGPAGEGPETTGGSAR